MQNLLAETQSNTRHRTSELLNHLNACLTMVRPAWMSDQAAGEWLTIAAADLSHLDPRTLAAAAKEARGKCTHHGQIVPTILGSRAVADERKFKALNWADREGDWERRKAQLANNPAQKLIASAAKGCRP